MNRLPPTRRNSEASIASQSDSVQIGLLLAQQANNARLTDWLSSVYDVVQVDSQSLVQSNCDLYIVDELMLERHYSRLRQLKDKSNSVFLPYLLLSTTSDSHPNNQAVWDLVDEIISMPTQKRALSHRLVNLLQRRDLSVDLSTEAEQQRDLFRNMFESSNDAVFIIDPESEEIRECNPQACELLGYSKDELRSSSPDLIHPDVKSEFWTFVDSVIENGRGYTTELTCRTKGDKQIRAEISASALHVDGQPHFLASVRDVTTRYEQRQVLKRLPTVTADMMEAPTKHEVAEVAVAAAKHVFGYNIAGVRLLNTESTPETLDLVAATSETFELLEATPTVYERGESVVGGVFERQESISLSNIQSSETPFGYKPIRSVMCFPLGAHGVVSIGATESAAFRDADVELMGLLAATTTAALTRAEREESLSEQTEYFRALFENATDAIADVKFENGGPYIQDVNPEFERVFGCERATVRGNSLTELVAPPNEEGASQSLIARAFVDGRTTVDTEGRRETATGQRDFLIRVVPIQQNDEHLGAYVVYTDITEQKRRDQQLQVLNRVLRHNIRNKLNIVRGAVEWSLDHERNVPTPLAESGLDAINELLDLSESARTLLSKTNSEQNLKPVPIVDLIERPVRSLREQYPDADISTAIETDEWLSGSVQLDRALKELCENAITHSTQASPVVAITAEPIKNRTDWVEITVEDNGPGIPDAQQAVLQKGEETQLQHGNGLGLWTVHWIVTTAGGDLTLSNRDGPGATVTLRLPTVGPDYCLQDDHSETPV